MRLCVSSLCVFMFLFVTCIKMNKHLWQVSSDFVHNLHVNTIHFDTFCEQVIQRFLNI
jgi:hypothetical protein